MSTIPSQWSLTLPGIFLVLFSFSLFVFRTKIVPGMLYVIATLIFFTLATISISLALAWRSSSSLSEVTKKEPITQVNIQAGSFYIFVIAGMLSDAMMIHRCYRLWDSKKSVIILPLLGLIGIFITWIVFEVLAIKNSSREGFDAKTQLEIANTTTHMFIDQMYGGVTLAENIILTGLIAGRVWWLEHTMNNILIMGKNKTKASHSLLGPIALNPIFLTLWVAAAYSPALSSLQLLTPCALTQIVGISSTLIVVSIGIGLSSESGFRSHMFDEEHQTSLARENIEESDPNTRIMQDDQEDTLSEVMPVMLDGRIIRKPQFNLQGPNIHK
ncbi:hypothetical protein BDP27DRAFT_1424562 [Rhodocollybia butyracea]|uniref:Uncharacterized protein n=1 Tax=Rhodocollybia butyracea TaxID=206335 RepID=A0A9P5PM48_9AGAR|nr:hypothetical protein BDP27DRAFT_1424562 [Rhodocollybia butyracea]